MKKFNAMLLALIVTAAMTTGCTGGGNDGNSDVSKQTLPLKQQSRKSKIPTKKMRTATMKKTMTQATLTLDNVRNQDGIGESELLVVSFGTSFNDSRRLTIGYRKRP